MLASSSITSSEIAASSNDSITRTSFGRRTPGNAAESIFSRWNMSTDSICRVS